MTMNQNKEAEWQGYVYRTGVDSYIIYIPRRIEKELDIKENDHLVITAKKQAGSVRGEPL